MAVARILGMILFSLFPCCSWLSVSSEDVTNERCLMRDLRLASSLMSIEKKPLRKQKIIFSFLNFVSLLRVFTLCTFCLAGVPEGRAPGVF